MQRLRIRFSRGEEIKYISHLDLIAAMAAGAQPRRIPLAYSRALTPTPAYPWRAPLALGVTSEAELMDIFLAKLVSPHSFTAAIGRQLPRGITVERCL